MDGNDPSFPGMAQCGSPHTVYSMIPPNITPAAPSDPAWDLTFIQLTQVLSPQIETCMHYLARQFRAMGLSSDMQVRQTPRGLSTFLALVGQRGLICIVDMTLIDGMAMGKGQWAELDISLLDACGDVAAEGLGNGVQGRTFHDISAALALLSEALDQTATAVFVAAFGHFDLLLPVAGHA